MRTFANSFLFHSLSITLQPRTTSQSECRLLRLIAYRLNAITAFSQKIPESQTKTHSDAKNIVRFLIAKTGYSNRNGIFVSGLKDLPRAA